MYIGPSSNSKLRRCDFMAIDMGRLKNKKTIMLLPNLRKRCIKRNFEGIHDDFLKDSIFRESQLEHDRTDEVCIQMDKIAQKDFTNRMTQEEYFRHRKKWWISINLERSDFNRALTALNRLHQESGMERFLVELMTINKKVRN